MSDQFQHVMVLTSIIIGLGITNALSGLSGGIERWTESARPLRLSWASLFWLGYTFLLMVLFWWWEFRLLGILKHWSLWNYFLIISYAIVLFVLVALLVPTNWDKVDDLNDYFLSKRRWFYSVLVLSLAIDLLDSYAKGGIGYIRETGVLTWGMNVAGIPVAIIGFRAPRIGAHVAMAMVFFVWQLAIGLDVFPLLHV